MSASDRFRADPALLAGLTAGRTIEAAAQLAHVSERTARRRLAHPDFQCALAAARRAVLTQALGVLVATTTAAAETLRELLRAESEAVRLRAATAILDAARAHVELDDLGRRLDSLEQQAKSREPTTLGGRRRRS